MKRLAGAVEQNRRKRRVAIQGWRHGELHSREFALHGSGHAREIALKMDAKREEVGQDVNLAGAPAGEQTDSAGKVGLAPFEERGLHLCVAAQPGELGGDQTHGLIGRFYTRPVGENDDSRLRFVR